MDWAIDARHHDRDLPHSDAVSGHSPLRDGWSSRVASRPATGISTTRATSSTARRDWRRDALEEGYDWAYREFYRWSSIARASLSHGTLKHRAKHFFYASGWKKFEPLWNVMIKARHLDCMTPVLEAVLSKVSQSEAVPASRHPSEDVLADA